MDLENALAAAEIRALDDDLSIEAARAQLARDRARQAGSWRQ
jgi:hypothetical protein